MAIGPYTTDILVFAGSTTNVTSQTNYVTLAPAGAQPGSIADANLNNKTMRQLSVVANTLTKLAADRNLVNITDSTTPLTQAILYPLLDNAFSKVRSPLPVSNGGTGVPSLTSNQVLTANITGTAIAGISPGSNGNLLTSNGTSWISNAPPAQTAVGGPAQTWTNQTANRNLGTTYTNSTGATISVLVILVNSNGAVGYVNGNEFWHEWYDVNTGAGQTGYGTALLLVPNNSTYSVSGGNKRFWWELR